MQDGTFTNEPDDEAADTTVPRVAGISQHDWNYWHSHPCSVALRKYLRDYAEALELAALQRWRARELDLATEHEIRARIVQLNDIEQLTFPVFADFYEAPKEETKAG